MDDGVLYGNYELRLFLSRSLHSLIEGDKGGRFI